MEKQGLINNSLKEFTKNLVQSELTLNEKFEEIANQALLDLDFPTSKVEAWKYSRLNKVKALRLTNSKPLSGPVEEANENSILVIDGVVKSVGKFPEIKVSLFSELKAEQLKEVGSICPLEKELFHSLNFKFMNDGIFITVPKNNSIKKPIHIIYESNSNETLHCPRLYVLSETASSLHIIQEFRGSSENALSIPVCEYRLEKNASLTVDKIQSVEGISFLIGSDYCIQNKDSRFTINTATISGNFIRNNLGVQVIGENCETNMNGLFYTVNNQHVDNHTLVEHKVSNCNSNELYKGIAKGKSTAVFNGKVVVHKDAQKINAFQSNANIVLDEKSKINSKPELEIYANDVKCSHGSTTGQLDEEALFYLRSRGLSESSARELLIQAFLAEVLSCFGNVVSKTIVESNLNKVHHWNL